jgi:hypothetical protein
MTDPDHRGPPGQCATSFLLPCSQLHHPSSSVATRGRCDQVQITSFIRTFSVTIAHCSKAFEAVVIIEQQAALQARGSRGGGGARRCTSTRRQRKHAIARVRQRKPHQREPHPTRPSLTAFEDHRRLSLVISHYCTLLEVRVSVAPLMFVSV